MPETEDLNNQEELQPLEFEDSDQRIRKDLLYEKFREFYSSPCSMSEWENEEEYHSGNRC